MAKIAKDEHPAQDAGPIGVYEGELRQDHQHYDCGNGDVQG